MSSRRSSSRRRSALVFPTLSEGVQNGLNRLVSDNKKGVASMLDVPSSETTVEVLTEKCAQVMKQQQLSAAQFLARFFEADMLSEHAVEVFDKSGKGSSAQLAERVANEWAKNKQPFPEKGDSLEKNTDESKRKQDPVQDDDSPVKKKKQKKKKSSSTEKE